jgi:undecaprenyl-diphosphatase
MVMSLPLLTRLDARDRALFARVAINVQRTPRARDAWVVISHCGGARATIAMCLASLTLESVSWTLAWRALLVLGVSHLVVQCVKRFAVRERPNARLSFDALIVVPDRFSFPSGHSCAAMSVAAVYAWAFPWCAPIVLGLALLVGLSRVVLGVHYPGDVVVGQVIALVTAAVGVRW